jgi:hypothetical protein
MVCTPDQVNPDAVANGAALAEHVIEHGVAGIDDDSARRFAGGKRHNGATQPFRKHVAASGAFIRQRGISRCCHDAV